jgi:16S rRNA (cytosine967-C5)-methyltransferase
MEGLSPAAFRLAALTLELVERHKLSLEAAFLEAVRKVGAKEEGALEVARRALLKFAEADFLLKLHGMGGLPLRRRCAFRVAYALMLSGGEPALAQVESGLLSGRLRQLLTRRGLERLEAELTRLPPIERIAISNSFPPWLVRKLAEKMPLREVEKLVKACSKRTVWVRANELKTSVQKVARTLEKVVTVKEDRDFPELLELVGVEDPPFEVLKLAERGLAIVQDKGSVAVVHALGARAGLRVLDAAAAPGVKTSLIQQLAGNAAEVVAVDASRRRVWEMRELLSKLGVKNVHVVVADAATLKLAQKFERVLLDAPCTNSGAIASDPALRLALWKEPEVDRYAKLQASMLANALQHLQPGGSLVYSTCSLLSEEGEGVADAVMQPERLNPSGIIGEPGYPGFRCSSRVRRLFPHIHRTTGFFIARYENPPE